jgi:predicted anti-sigma-YlaC factor YlaD
LKTNFFLALAMGVVLGSSGCSVRKYAVNKLGDALAQSGGTFASDDDPELIRQAVPFSLKLVESLLAESPRHPGLLMAATSGFTQYAYAFVQQDADKAEDRDLEAALASRNRAKRLYLRARNYGLRGLEVKHPHFSQQLRTQAKESLRQLGTNDVPWLYWTSVSWAAAIALSKDDPDLVADVPLIEAMVDRALELNESYNYGALHSFMISFEPARQGQPGDALTRIKPHFERAKELSQGQLAGPYVAYAETVSVQKQNANEFKSLLQQALTINPDARPEWRLENLVTQQRARWLLSRLDELFLSAEPAQ